MSYYRGSMSAAFRMTPWVKRLLIANAAVFVVLLVAPALATHLAFMPSRVLARPWTLITYMFVHAGFLHLLFNMIGLFFFGPPLEERWGSREFLKYYLICGLGGAVLSFFFGMYGAVVGASAAVFGIMLAFAMNWPNSPIYIWGIFPIKAKWLVGVLAAMALLSAVGGASDGVAHFAHIGGFVAGFLYLRLDDPIRARLASLKSKMPRSRLTVVSGKATRQASQVSRSHHEEERILDEVDRVLDKISHDGLSSLTAEERQLLDDVSRRYRSN